MFVNPMAAAAFRVSSTFGPRTDPITGKTASHSGIDLAAPVGTPVVAMADGVVTRIQNEFQGGGAGNNVRVQHADGYECVYMHLHSIAVVEGQKVSAGTILGTVGSTGRSTGPHLHLSVYRDGVAVDPAPLIAWNVVKAGSRWYAGIFAAMGAITVVSLVLYSMNKARRETP